MDIKDKVILVVDDMQPVLDLLKNFFNSKFKCTVHTENDSHNAIKKALKIVPDLIILDVAMPDKSGDQIANDIKKFTQLSKTKLIFFSGIFTSIDEALKYNHSNPKYICVPKTTPLSEFEKIIKEILSDKL